MSGQQLLEIRVNLSSPILPFMPYTKKKKDHEETFCIGKQKFLMHT